MQMCFLGNAMFCGRLWPFATLALVVGALLALLVWLALWLGSAVE